MSPPKSSRRGPAGYNRVGPPPKAQPKFFAGRIPCLVGHEGIPPEYRPLDPAGRLAEDYTAPQVPRGQPRFRWLALNIPGDSTARNPRAREDGYKVVEICRYFNTPEGCNLGPDCRRYHFCNRCLAGSGDPLEGTSVPHSAVDCQEDPDTLPLHTRFNVRGERSYRR